MAPDARPRSEWPRDDCPRSGAFTEPVPRRHVRSRSPSSPALWALFGPTASGAIALTAWRLDAGAIEWTVAAVLCLLLVSGGLAMALGLRALAPWARHLQIASSYLGLLACPFTPAAATTLLYMNRSDVRRAFEPGEASGGAGAAETTFALSIVAMVLVGVAVTGIAAFLIWPAAHSA